MLESGARAPRHCFGARHSRPRAAQVVSDWLTILSNRLLVAKCAHVQAAGSARALSCLIDISCLWTPNPQTSGWLVPLRDANERTSSHSVTSHWPAYRKHRCYIPYLRTTQHPTAYVNLQRDKWLPLSRTTRCFVAPNAQRKAAATWGGSNASCYS